MSLLSKAEVRYLEGHKRVSKSYEYKLKSIIKRKLTTFIDKELPLLSSLPPHAAHLTKYSKMGGIDYKLSDLTNFSKEIKIISPNKKYSRNGGKTYPAKPDSNERNDNLPEYYINNPLKLIKNTESSGGVEANTSHTIRLSISPSQGDDPGFKSRPEHPVICLFTINFGSSKGLFRIRFTIHTVTAQFSKDCFGS